MHIVFMDKCNAQTTLKDNEIRITKQRLQMMQAILDYPHPFSVSQLHANNLQIADLATFYRFVRLLVAKDIIKSVASEDDTQYYELLCPHNPNHPHFLCKSCHKLICLEAIRTPDVFRLADYAQKMHVEDLTLLYRGKCRACEKHSGV